MPRDYFKMTLEYRLLQKYGDRLGEVLRSLYIDQRLPVRETLAALGCHSLPALRALFEKYGVPMRRGSAAVANQHIRNPTRRERSRAVMTAMATKRAAEGLHWANGQTKETHAGLAAISDKLTKSGRLLRPDVRARAAASRNASLLLDPMAHPQARMPPTRMESLFMAWLDSWSFAYSFNVPFVVGERVIFIDFVLPDYGIGIEVVGHTRFDPERARQIYAAGLVPLGVPNSQVRIGELGGVYEAIARVYKLDWRPATLRECWMARCRGKMSARRKAELDESIR